MLVNDFIKQLKNSVSHPTVYMWGAFGQPVSKEFVNAKAKQYPHWYTVPKIQYLHRQIGKAFAFDCIGLLKGIAWGWIGDRNHSRGGAIYQSNGVQDQTSTGMFNRCKDISTDFTNIQIGEAVHMIGHIGVYIGDGKVIESTPIWSDGVQITNLSQRNWLRHGKLYFVDYSGVPEWNEVLMKYADAPDIWVDYINSLKTHHMGRWLPDFIMKLSNKEDLTFQISDWKEAILSKMVAGDEWIDFVESQKSHPLGKWLPTLIIKIYNKESANV